MLSKKTRICLIALMAALVVVIIATLVLSTWQPGGSGDAGGWLSAAKERVSGVAEWVRSAKERVFRPRPTEAPKSQFDFSGFEADERFRPLTWSQITSMGDGTSGWFRDFDRTNTASGEGHLAYELTEQTDLSIKWPSNYEDRWAKSMKFRLLAFENLPPCIAIDLEIPDDASEYSYLSGMLTVEVNGRAYVWMGVENASLHWTHFPLLLTDESFGFLTDLCDADTAIIRLNSTYEPDQFRIEGTLETNEPSREGIALLRDKYIEAGGLNEDFSKVREECPCWVGALPLDDADEQFDMSVLEDRPWLFRINRSIPDEKDEFERMKAGEPADGFARLGPFGAPLESLVSMRYAHAYIDPNRDGPHIFSDQLGYVDFYVMNPIGYPPLIEMELSMNKAVAADTLELTANGRRYAFKNVDRVELRQEKGTMERYQVYLTGASLDFLMDMIASGGADLKLTGEGKLVGYIYFSGDIGDAFLWLRDAFVMAGGLNNDFSEIEEAYPCEIEEIETGD